MQPATLERLNDPGLIEALHRQFERLEAVYEGEPLQPPFTLHGIAGKGGVDPYEEPARWAEACLDDLAKRADALLDQEVFRPLVVEYAAYGVRFIDALFGAHVYPTEHSWWGDGLDQPVGGLAPPDIEDHCVWRMARAAAEAFTAHAPGAVLFGMPTLSSALNIAVNLFGERFLMALLTDPAGAKRDLTVINGLILDLHRWYLENVPLEQLQPVIAFERTQPPGFGQLCGCTTHLLPEDQYAEFAAGLDEALLAAWPRGGMIHLCGEHTQHLPLWRAMEPLRAVQLNDRAAEDLEAYAEGLRDDQVIYLNPTETMTAARALEITGGRRLVLVQDGL
jgi:hypothetical protein